jgi:hypothetical protein
MNCPFALLSLEMVVYPMYPIIAAAIHVGNVAIKEVSFVEMI